MSSKSGFWDVCVIVARHKARFALHFISISVAAVIISLLLTKYYKSTVVFMPQGPRSSMLTSILGSEMVVDFLREHVDHGIRNIELSDNGRFTVVHDHVSPNPDLTAFGDGIQRIFKIGLLFAGARNGVVLIDEFENAIHASVLSSLALLVHSLAVKFNVQVFLASHSKECIDAFVKNDFQLDDVSVYAIRTEQGRPVAHHYEGSRLDRLLDIADVDMRGGSPEV